jgi:hypothetical protein
LLKKKEEYAYKFFQKVSYPKLPVNEEGHWQYVRLVKLLTKQVPPFRQVEEVHTRFKFVWQLAPVKFALHEHVYWLFREEQVAPFKHGLETHAFWYWQTLPV